MDRDAPGDALITPVVTTRATVDRVTGELTTVVGGVGDTASDTVSGTTDLVSDTVDEISDASIDDVDAIDDVADGQLP